MWLLLNAATSMFYVAPDGQVDATHSRECAILPLRNVTKIYFK